MIGTLNVLNNNYFNMDKIDCLNIGNAVMLRSGGCGGLNPIFLREEGYTDQSLTIIDQKLIGNQIMAVVELPFGLEILIGKKDIY